MNNLNSVLIEGTLSMNPEYTTSENEIISGAFIIESNRYFKKDGELEKESLFFSIIMSNGLAVNMREILLKEMFIRLVGRLSQDEDGDVIIIAEHIEIKNQGDNNDKTTATIN